MPINKEASVLVIYTGGTFGMIYDYSSGSLVPFNIQDLLLHIPELKRMNTDLDFISFERPLDSSNIKPVQWIKIAQLIRDNYSRYDGFVILHGTDTMAYSASALSYLLENLDKPVIFTGAQLPISEVRSDARENFITAIEIAASKENGKSIVNEVCIYFDNYLLRGNRSRKMQSSHFDAFLSENYPYLAQAGINIEYNRSSVFPRSDKALTVYEKMDENVAVIKLFPGISDRMIAQIFKTEGLRAVVLETFGSGNAHTDDSFIKVLGEAINRGIIIYNVSQCVGGMVTQGRYETSQRLKEIGVISGGSITTEAAVTKLMFVLANEPYKNNSQKWLQESLRGEMEL